MSDKKGTWPRRGGLHHIPNDGEAFARADVLAGGGYVELLDFMGGDSSIVAAARTTSRRSSRGADEDAKLIRYLVRHRHDSPLEFCEMMFRVRAPILVARQWVRHRTASWNEESARYGVVEDAPPWTPKEWRGQAENNRQASDGVVEHEPMEFADRDGHLSAEEAGVAEYKARIDSGVSRELARSCLPLSTWTTWVWKVNLRNLLHFLHLRTDANAQEEIRVYADAMEKMAEGVAPVAVGAWRSYVKNAIVLSEHEVEMIQTRKQPAGMTDNEARICVLKAARLGVQL